MPDTTYFEGETTFHAYNDITHNGKTVCRVVNLHVNSGDAEAGVIDLTRFITEHKDNDEEIPVFFGGDGNVHYNGDKTENIKTLKDNLAKIGYTLVIAKHIIRKRRPNNIFQNAQGIYKFEITTEETMFFAYPTGLKEKINYTFQDISFDDEIDTDIAPEIVDAFAGSIEKPATWENIISKIKETGYKEYLPYLLSDHVPMYLDFNDKGIDYRFMFANNVSLLGDRGVIDNSTRFGLDIDVKQLEQWSKELVKPIMRGTIALIKQYKPLLEDKEINKWGGFQSLITKAEKLLADNVAVEELYKPLEKLAKHKLGDLTNVAKRIRRKQLLNKAFKGPETLGLKVHFLKIPAKFPCKRNKKACTSKICNDCGGENNKPNEERVICLTNPERKQIASMLSLWKIKYGRSGKVPGVRQFLNYALNPKSIPGEKNTCSKKLFKYSIISSLFNATDLGTVRRRMAQREFSDRRDSPVMTRLLDEIIAAQSAQDKRDD